MRLETLDMRFLLTAGFSLRATTSLSKRANLTKQYAQRTVTDEPRGNSAPQRGATTHPCGGFWCAPKTGHCGTSLHLYSSLRLLPIYMRSLREQDLHCLTAFRWLKPTNITPLHPYTFTPINH